MAWIEPSMAVVFLLGVAVYFAIPWISLRFVFVRERAAAVLFAAGWLMYSLWWRPWEARAKAAAFIDAGEAEVSDEWMMTFTSYWMFATGLIVVCTIAAFRPSISAERDRHDWEAGK